MTEPEKKHIKNDEPASEDGLGRTQYAASLARLTKECETPLVVGLYGSWGVGKTSFMRLIEKQLDKKENLIVRFAPWEHQFNENPALSLMHTMVDQLSASQDPKEKDFLKDPLNKLLNGIALAFGSMLYTQGPFIKGNPK